MPSASFIRWTGDRAFRLDEIDNQCAAACAGASPTLADENLRGYVVLLSANFQGFCLDLYTESFQLVVSRISRRTIQLVLQAQFSAGRSLEKGNPTLDNIGRDFDRFGFDLKAKLKSVPTLAPHNYLDLSELNKWRNAAAHGSNPPSLIPLNLTLVQKWRAYCTILAAAIDDVMYNQLLVVLGKKPWKP